MFGKLWKKELGDNSVVVAVVFCGVVTQIKLYLQALCVCVCVCVHFSESICMLIIKVETASEKYSTHA